MRSAKSNQTIAHSLVAMGVFMLILSGAGSAGAQSNNDQTSSLNRQVDRPDRRAVGSGSFRQIYWKKESLTQLYDMRLTTMARGLERAPGVMRNTNVWTARADVCDEPGDEILVQIRSPLTCGSLGCQMMVISEASGAPRVLLSTIGDSVDSGGQNALVTNEGTDRERVWTYSRDKFQRMPNRR